MNPNICRIGFTAALLAMLASPSYAAVNCPGTVNNHYIDSTGNAFVTHSVVGTVQICNVNIDWKAITPTQCFAWLALVKQGVSKPASMVFNYSTTACTGMPQLGAAPAPLYIQLNTL